jgi:hypothetical protein
LSPDSAYQRSAAQDKKCLFRSNGNAPATLPTPRSQFSPEPLHPGKRSLKNPAKSSAPYPEQLSHGGDLPHISGSLPPARATRRERFLKVLNAPLLASPCVSNAAAP